MMNEVKEVCCEHITDECLVSLSFRPRARFLYGEQTQNWRSSLSIWQITSSQEKPASLGGVSYTQMIVITRTWSSEELRNPSLNTCSFPAEISARVSPTVCPSRSSQFWKLCSIGAAHSQDDRRGRFLRFEERARLRQDRVELGV